MIIIEGCFSFKNLQIIEPDLRIWLELDRNIAKTRLNDREIMDRPEINLKLIELATQKYQESEDRYISTFNPVGKADLVLDAQTNEFKIINQQ